ncbi:hypothetical protein [Catalinimonas niigatensis]|uniref:hypothetical protein n=1 Tax=Catalinimonas niigatensis TaxID=1397264 RepID=UPI002665DDB7|nr:hypothetical protein [Catalinimonas niigatensis]WPP52729.1 hypothetical protein PZB72_10100 [Catalinimonas niigatensis]
MAGQTIIKAGYGIEYSDRDFFSINSEPKRYSYGQLELNISVSGNDNAVVRIIGTYKTEMNEFNNNIGFRGMKGLAERDAWDEMHSVAEKIKGELVYTII